MPEKALHETGLPPQSQSSRNPKNIIVCCDGTGNEFGDANSNVVKIYTALAVDDDQVAYYHPGVGTMGDPAVRNRLLRWWSKVKGLAFAYGFKDNVFDAYRYLMSVYNDGDHVYLFGFSRGAYTVRALGGLLDGYGLLCQGNEGHLPYAWRLYVNQHSNRNRHSIDHTVDSAAAFKETFSRKNFKIYFVGVWDTVSSIGWIYSPVRLFSVARNPTIQNGRQALSIDERRCFYRDNIWGKPLPGQSIVQVWFAGVHSDVGGSYPQNQSGLSNITLKWMLDEAKQAGVTLIEDRVRLVLGEKTDAYPECQPLYQKPKLSIVHRSLAGVWWIAELLPHLYYAKNRSKELYRIPFGTPRVIPQDALVHSSVKERLDDPAANYHPKNLNPAFLKPADAIPGEPPLYRYTESPAETSNIKRWLLLILFSTLWIVVLLAALFLAIKLGVWLWCGAHKLIHWIAWEYRKLNTW